MRFAVTQTPVKDYQLQLVRSIVIVALGTIPEDLVSELEELEFGGRAEYIQNHHTVKISQNTEKNPGDLRRLVIHIYQPLRSGRI